MISIYCVKKQNKMKDKSLAHKALEIAISNIMKDIGQKTDTEINNQINQVCEDFCNKEREQMSWLISNLEEISNRAEKAEQFICEVALMKSYKFLSIKSKCLKFLTSINFYRNPIKQ